MRIERIQSRQYLAFSSKKFVSPEHEEKGLSDDAITFDHEQESGHQQPESQLDQEAKKEAKPPEEKAKLVKIKEHELDLLV